MGKIRLQRVLQRAGVCSRRNAVDIIVAGRVSVDGEVIRESGFSVDPDSQLITLDGVPLQDEPKVLFSFHKPTGVTSTMVSQGGAKCIADFVGGISERVVPIGRLDKDVSGLLLLTNHGQFSQQLAHPRFEVLRTYLAVCEGSESLARTVAPRLLEGVVLDDGLGRAAHFDVVPASKSMQLHFSGIPPSCVLVRLGVTEGRHHFVKRFLAAVGLPVVKLSRISFGPYSLGSLEPGELRPENFDKSIILGMAG